jgi:hypothetical protein
MQSTIPPPSGATQLTDCYIRPRSYLTSRSADDLGFVSHHICLEIRVDLRMSSSTIRCQALYDLYVVCELALQDLTGHRDSRRETLNLLEDYLPVVRESSGEVHHD